MWNLTLMLAFTLGAEPVAENCPGFRGDGTGNSNTKHLPVSWSAKEGIAWKTTLPCYGQAAPVVWGNRVYVTAVEGEQKEKYHLVAADANNCELAWQGKKAICHHATPLVCQGQEYFVTKTGIVYCIDLKTGEEGYSERLENQYWATPVAAGDVVYFFGKDGMTTILQAGPKYEKIASNRLWNQEELEARKEAAKKTVAAKTPARSEGKGPGGGPPLPKEERVAIRNSTVGDFYSASPPSRVLSLSARARN